jgi:hypothetical protein
MQLLMPTESEIAWAAGFFEGEGYFSGITRSLKDGPRLYPTVGINNCDLDMLLRFQAIVGVGTTKPRTKSKTGVKPQFRWIVTARADVEHVRDLLWPWLSERRRARADELFDNRGSLLTRSHCLRGHAYTPENTYQWKHYRWCRACREEKRVRHRTDVAAAAWSSWEVEGVRERERPEFESGDRESVATQLWGLPAMKAATVEQTRVLFDIAIQSLDFGSGCLDDDEVEVLRAVAVSLGVDPWDATPDNHRPKYCPGHEWEQWSDPYRRQLPSGYGCLRQWRYCTVCRKQEIHEFHDPAEAR